MNSLKRKREGLAMTQAEVADILGVTQACVAMWETGDAYPRADKLPALARVLGCTIDDLFEDEGGERDG